MEGRRACRALCPEPGSRVNQRCLWLDPEAAKPPAAAPGAQRWPGRTERSEEPGHKRGQQMDRDWDTGEWEMLLRSLANFLDEISHLHSQFVVLRLEQLSRDATDGPVVRVYTRRINEPGQEVGDDAGHFQPKRDTISLLALDVADSAVIDFFQQELQDVKLRALRPSIVEALRCADDSKSSCMDEFARTFLVAHDHPHTASRGL
jgi:hypothetical protein